MSTLIFDIETVGEDFDRLDETSQDVLTRWITREAESSEQYAAALADLKNGMGFSPLTGQIVAIECMMANGKKGPSTSNLLPGRKKQASKSTAANSK